MWKRLNQLEDVKPMVWINEVCWNEMDVDSELSLLTGSSFCRRIESYLRQTLYQWEHMQGDMVIDPVICSPLVVENSGVGVEVKEDTLKTDETNVIVSHHFHSQIRNEEDIEKIRFSQITHDEKKLQINYHAYREIFEGILKVEMCGVPGFDPEHVKALDIWGCATARIFSAVSPQMHEEFALKYEKLWLERFGLSYYGCCDPLHKKIHILKDVKNLRKISISPWVDIKEAADAISGDYVFSLKPSPAVLAEDLWNPEKARHEVETKLQVLMAHNCKVEIIMKDISTVRYEPTRLWEWARIATKAAERFG